jgi:hypothetical protein
MSSAPRLLDTKTPHESAIGSLLALGTQLIGVPPVPPPPVLLELDVPPPAPVGQLTSLFAQSSGEVKKHPTTPKAATRVKRPTPDVVNARPFQRIILLS